jgi:hypothetical protein
VQEPNFELWRQRREQVMREVETDRLGRKLRVARQGASSRPAPDSRGLRIAGRILAALRPPRAKPGTEPPGASADYEYRVTRRPAQGTSAQARPARR